jgi:hypothetical protein
VVTDYVHFAVGSEVLYVHSLDECRGTRWRSWLRHYATNWNVAGSIPDNRFGRTMALGLTQPLSEMSTRNISWGVKAAGA